MTQLVWISDWEVQCCGDDFAVGDEVRWPLERADLTGGYWEPLLGPLLAAELDLTYAGHEEPAVARIPATVRGIRTVSCRYAPLPPPADQRTLHVVPGSAALEPVEAVDKWHDSGPDADLRFTGWLVEVELA